jgi:hypothetical protein
MFNATILQCRSIYLPKEKRQKKKRNQFKEEKKEALCYARSMHAVRLEKSSSNGSKESKTADSLLASRVDNGRLTVVSRARSLTLGARVRVTGGALGSGVGVTRGTLGAGVGGVTTSRGSRLVTGVRTAGGRSRLGSRVGRRSGLGTTSRRSGLGTVLSRRSGLGTVLSRRAGGRRASRELRNLGVVRSTVAVLPRLVDDLTVLARLAVSRSVADVVVVPVIALLRLVDGETVAVSVGAVLGDVLRSTLARARLDNVDVLAVAVLTRVGLEDVDDAAALSGVGVALSVVALVDSGDGLGLGSGGALDGGGEGGGDSGLVGHGSSDDIGESNISTADRDVDGEEDGVGDGGLAAVEAAAARDRSITTTELSVVTGALNVAEVSVDALGVVIVDLITTVAVSVVNTKVATAVAEVGAALEVHRVGSLSKLKGREAVVRTDTAEESKVTNGAGEASSGGTGGGRSGLSTGGSDGLALGVGGGTLRVGVSLGGSLSSSNSLALRVGRSTLGIGVGLSVGVGRDDGVGDGASRLALAVGQSGLGDDGVATTVTTISFASGNLDVGNTESDGVLTTRLNELKIGSVLAGLHAPARPTNKGVTGLEIL